VHFGFLPGNIESSREQIPTAVTTLRGSNKILNHIFAILVSTSYYKSDVEKIFADGVNRYVAKNVFN